MRSPTRISPPQPSPPHSGSPGVHYRNPYEELAELADPEDPDDPLGIGLKPEDDDADLGGRRGKPVGSGSVDDGEPWSPPNHRRSSRRRRGRLKAVPRLAKALIGLVVLGLLLVLGDRWAVMYAERKAEEQLQKKLDLATAPRVTIHGFPFLTQVLGKHLQQVDIAVPDVAADRVSLAEVRAQAQDIRIVGDLPSSFKGAVVGRMKGDVLLSFEDLNRELGASQVRFRALGPSSVRADGKLPVANKEVSLHAKAHIRRQGDRGISTSVTDMRLDIPEIATYRPGPGPRAGLFLHKKAAEQISEDSEKARALLSVPSVAEKLGLAPEEAGQTRNDDRQLDRITGSPRFVPALLGVNLVQAVNDHPQLARKLGIDPTVAAALARLKVPELTDKLQLSFQLPEKAKGIRLANIGVSPEGIRADLTGAEMNFGKTR
ncbi:LmeA family phospholipid-binding protein [Streptomyces hygroscopicus]|uniref:LmeA family phospholipid-binding protein n=1 Tax=Streptomyces hygroscopicus TaxID=1912 RepID=UPI0033EC7B96